MSLIDKTYFQVEPVFIPNSNSNVGGISQDITTDRDAQILRLINVNEPKYLKALLGVDMYNLFIAGFAETTPDVKWTALKAKIVDEANKISPIANYICVIYLGSRATTEAGIVMPKVENATQVSVIEKQCEIWNEMVDMNLELCQWLFENSATYETDTVEFPLWVEGIGLLRRKNIFNI